jgi:hypothetical protein
MKKILSLLSIIITLTSCTDAEKSQWGGLGDKHTVEMYSGGKLVKTWVSTGKVQSSSSSDGYYFRDQECDCNVEVSGDVVITRIK